MDNPNAYGTSANDWFGISISISGDKCIVGASYEGDDSGTYSGKAYIFSSTKKVISQSVIETIPTMPDSKTSAYIFSKGFAESNIITQDTGETDFKALTDIEVTQSIKNMSYKTSVADTLVSTSPISSGDKLLLSTGSTKVSDFKEFIVDKVSFSAGGNLLHTLDNPNAYGTSSGDNFGNSVAISGDKCIVGAHGEDDDNGKNSGKAYIFSTDGSLISTLDNPNAYDTSAGDYFGTSVAISGDKCIVGAPEEGDAGGKYSGKAYIFSTDGKLLSTLDNPNAYGTSTNDWLFGKAVAISGDKCIVGAPGEDDDSGTKSGKAYIFSTDGKLLHTLDNPNGYGTSEGDNFGNSVAISGDKCIVGAPGEDDDSGTSSGKAYIFSTDGTLLHTLDNPNAYGTSADDNFGFSVAISGDKCIVGAYGEGDTGGTNSGKAYIFSTDGNLLHTLDNPNVHDTSESDYFGISVAISGDKCIVGAYGEDDDNGDSGKAYIFSTSSATYTADTSSVTKGEIPKIAYKKYNNISFDFGQGWIKALERNDTINDITGDIINIVSTYDTVGSISRTIQTRVDFLDDNSTISKITATIQKEK